MKYLINIGVSWLENIIETNRVTCLNIYDKHDRNISTEIVIHGYYCDRQCLSVLKQTWDQLHKHSSHALCQFHDDVIKWKRFPRNWPFVRGIHRSLVNSPHKSQWRGALMFSLICVWINDWINNRKAGDLRRYRAHYDVFVMFYSMLVLILPMRCQGCRAKPHGTPSLATVHLSNISLATIHLP